MFRPRPLNIIILILIILTVIGCSQTTDSQSTGDSTETFNVSHTRSAPETIKTNGSKEPLTWPNGKLIVHFLYVGQGDSILIQTPSGKTMLIDAGPAAAGNTVEKYLKAHNVKKIDILIGTHPHEDHIGGMAGIIENFGIGQIYLPKVSHTTKTFANLLGTIKSQGLRVSTARGGVELDLGSGIEAKFTAPNGASYTDLNDYSAVFELAYSKTSFLFEGDAEGLSESEMLARGYNLDVDVLKVGHHGSSSSSSKSFLKAVTPKYAVISVGAGNSYGHPAAETLSALAAVGAKVFRTDESGTITMESDGFNIAVTVMPLPAGTSEPD